VLGGTLSEVASEIGKRKAIEPRNMTDYLGTLSRYKLLILLVAVTMGVAAYFVTRRHEAQYQATSKLLVNQGAAAGVPNVGSNPSVTDPTELERLTSTQIRLAQIPAVATAALRRAHVRDMTSQELLANVSLTEEPNADLVDVSVTAGTPRLAERLSAAYASAFASYQARLVGAALSRELSGVESTIDRELRDAGSNRTRLTNSSSFQQLLSLRDEVAAAAADAPRSSVVASAAQTATKTAPKPLRNTALAAVLGLLLGCGLAFLLDARDRRARSTNEIGEVLGLNLLARIPAPPRRWWKRSDFSLTMLRDPGSVQAEAIKMLQANLEFARMQGQAQAVLFTSAVGQEGKSTTVANLAASLAQAGRNVVVVDGDLRQPSLSRLFNVPDQPGLAEVALGHVPANRARELLAYVELDEALTPPSLRGTLRVLPAGRREDQPDRLLSSPALPVLFTELREDTDWILVDTPPLTKFYDALIASQHVDALVAVAKVRFVQRATLAEFGRLLWSAPVNALGFVATGVGHKGTTKYELPSTPPDAEGPPAVTGGRLAAQGRGSPGRRVRDRMS
jgi:capsular exopolysaccharide synthesis family protein